MPQWIKLAVSHVIAGAACVVVPNVIWVVVYFTLLLIAIVTNGSIGSPISLPLTAAIITAGSLAASVFVFCPATIVASQVRSRRALWMQAPMEFAVAAMVAFLICSAFVVRPGEEPWQIQLVAAGRVWLLLGPGLALYWLIARSSEGLLALFGGAASWARRRFLRTK